MHTHSPSIGFSIDRILKGDSNVGIPTKASVAAASVARTAALLAAAGGATGRVLPALSNNSNGNNGNAIANPYWPSSGALGHLVPHLMNLGAGSNFSASGGVSSDATGITTATTTAVGTAGDQLQVLHMNLNAAAAAAAAASPYRGMELRMPVQSPLMAAILSQVHDRFNLLNRRIGHPYQNRTPPKRKKPRTSFSRHQVSVLEERFGRQKYLASSERSALAKGLKMTDSQVKTWFQNRRTKWRRQKAEEREQERHVANRLLAGLGLQSDMVGKLPPAGPTGGADSAVGSPSSVAAAAERILAGADVNGERDATASSLDALQNFAAYAS